MSSLPATYLQRPGPEPARYLAGQRASTTADRIIGTVQMDPLPKAKAWRRDGSFQISKGGGRH